MKIAILSFYSGSSERGVENWTQEIAGKLSVNHKVVVYQRTSTVGQSYGVEVVKVGFNDSYATNQLGIARRFFIDYASLKIAWFTLKCFPKLFKKGYDIVVPTNGGWQSAMMRLFTWLTGAKMVIVGHSGIGWDDRNNLWCFPDTFVALSTVAKDWAIRVTPFKSVVVIPDGVDLRKFGKSGPKVKIGTERPIVLLVAALEESKRIGLAIKAVSKMKKGSLLVLGGGSKEKDIMALGTRILGNRFKMMKVSYQNIQEYYRAVDVFTLPSWGREAFGMVYLEAMACGLPVVATDDDLRREIVGDAGILVDPTIVEDYTKALEECAGEDWGNKPRIQAEKFGWDKVSRMYEDLFLKLAA
ncbi:hypothetical protein A3D84_00620 [Candidatus Woesebacteria bacterium RIFCSPHIGHO2_02_FULL_42_20]|uniref:Glycosyl transferase family 1 domain-containing protein n=1 Tax=Candidatus Woesebacteria bacterium RIFCSPHIGHO2_12_FULL_41_24 TaxID=1802510 RepID=A0A1F8APY8_9BACT|nr:MAG: hypothetical protein A2W15_04845 [Candidatus Woesebacteria bacterium RBG_16_41_13]OGM30626.1 MAG: hypothetical protein A2873_00740 [Candidatus Woesebacteria bacterium RIFCSPHIGHO2_01_FULL_42_80]OGM35763.1 MAG: hypothetical protein A3D84_00620 [Candidatus Woesebacteria bacterium RIFCSPHIGHO2_02_FULL_42_20]OGM53822.1 MAG: hypothetical protein A3E44_05390 [Candidatus Woesebacteria bacterium RIFCSPHIGHO2_12_FULL_41_24]OGM66014.1 MAG: hypothetical protein A2969_03485 [Candidatus Woesebacteri